MDDTQRRVLRRLTFNWAPTADDVWRPAPFHVADLHGGAIQTVLGGFEEAEDYEDSSPIGVVVLGQRGAGKTHLLGVVRERVQAADGYFFLVNLYDTLAFWRSTVLSVLDGLTREPVDGMNQLHIFTSRLAERVGAPRNVRRAVTGEAELSRPVLDAFVDLLRKSDKQVAVDCQDTLRALALRASDDPRSQDVGHTYLCSNDEEEPGERASWGIRRGKRSAQEIVKDISRLLALTGPTLIAVDQIDLLIAQSVKSAATTDPDQWKQTLVIEQIAGGLMSLREVTKRTVTVVTCLPAAWEEIKTKATDTVQDRFTAPVRIERVAVSKFGRELVARRFQERFERLGFTPPYPTWPILESAFDTEAQFTPRELLVVIDAHIKACLNSDTVSDLRTLGGAETKATVRTARVVPPVTPALDLDPFDLEFAELRGQAAPELALAAETEDTEVPSLLTAGLLAWIEEQGTAGQLFSVDPPPGDKPALHARLRLSIEGAIEDEAHWAFRAISADHGNAVLNRLRNASTGTGLTEGVSKRRLFLLRNKPYSTSKATQQVLEAFGRAGGVLLRFPEEDIRTLSALRGLRQAHEHEPEAFRTWLQARKPTTTVTFLTEALTDVVPDALSVPIVAVGPDETHEPAREVPADAVLLGTTDPSNDPVIIALESLRRHTAIFAGSGSGKTVLIRRLIEECALQGVSTIVLDPNNDLARLGDAWPEAPSSWLPADAGKARDYLAHTEVVIWTPRRENGRPLAFQPLPDFGGVMDDPDEFGIAVDAAVGALAPRAKVDGSTGKAQLGRAVLQEAMRAYARQGGQKLKGFIDLLANLPEGISELDNAEKLASEMSQTLYAATVIDPLFGGKGTPVDPGVLLTPARGKRARVSVISLIGLEGDEQRQSFVNQLQLALFSWIKRNPAGDRPLGGLFVMDEAQSLAPSGALTACTQSTLALASQARKYGLGLVFATQAPKGIHNRITGNAATQLYGLLTNPVQISAAREMAKMKGGDVPDIARLGQGQFYATVEGDAFRKLRSPLCLTHHPKSPLTPEEVLDRARTDVAR
ncbi:ATP-binding protein [Dactylosporangium sp. NPDC050588]|uniref:ATP-binding protein n=1 Tax=Dactylosporangium sp. NPDC050588 TaxID=3157211 RepID=UPI0033F03022